MKMTKLRLTLLLIGTLYMLAVVGFIHGQERSSFRGRDGTVTELELRETDEHVGALAVQVARIETAMEMNAKASESTRTLITAIAVPVSLLALEGMFRLLTALASRATRRQDGRSRYSQDD